MARSRFVVARMIALSVLVCGPALVASAASAQDGAGYPVEIENCGRTLRFEEPPRRAVLSYHPVAEMFVGLGLADHAVGRAGFSGEPPLLPEQAEDFAKIPVVSDSVYPPPREQLLALRPDFLLAYGDFDHGAGSAQGLATLEQLERAGVRVYSVTCPDPTGNYAGESLEATYRSILDLGRIFGVEDRARERVEQMRQQIADVRARVEGLPPVEVIMYAGGEGPLDLSGGVGINNELLEAAGGANLFSEEGLYFQASLEAVAEEDPEAFVIFGDLAGPNGELEATEASDFLFETFPNMRASQDRRVVLTAFVYTAPGWRNAQTVEDLARQLHPEAFE